MWQKARKAFVAAFWGGVSAVGSGFVFTGAPTRAQLGVLLGLFLAGAATTFGFTYRSKPNAAAQ